MTIQRQPAAERLPGCYTMHRADERAGRCTDCEHRSPCVRATAANGARLTVHEAAARALTEYQARRTAADGGELYPVDLVVAARDAFRAAGGTAVGWPQQRPWVQAMAAVIASCRAAGWDPRTYVRAQVETVGWMCTQRNFALRPAMFLGAGAARRFKDWAARNAKRHGDESRDRMADPEREHLLAGECCFAERYFAVDAQGTGEAEGFSQQTFTKWALAKTVGRPDVRLPALAAALATLERGLPHRMLAPEGAWEWEEARAAALALYPPKDVHDEPFDLDPELGVML